MTKRVICLTSLLIIAIVLQFPGRAAGKLPPYIISESASGPNGITLAVPDSLILDLIALNYIRQNFVDSAIGKKGYYPRNTIL